MNGKLTALIAGLSLATFCRAASTNGVAPGMWTMDIDAAKAYAAEHHQPILLDFSGSDWCGWCKLMEEQVFTKDAWKAYSASNIVMVLIDFPQDQSLVPEAYAPRNQALADQYGIEGFPTFVVLDEDGETELGRLQAGSDKTPESFIEELKMVLRNSKKAISTYADSLPAEQKARFLDLRKRIDQKKAEMQEAEKAFHEAMEAAELLGQEMGALNAEMKEFRIEQMGEEKVAEYKAILAEHAAKVQELSDWLDTNPDENEENMAKYSEMQETIMALGAKIDGF